MIEIIVSGGQTGVDRAASDAAIDSFIRHSGWCPKGRKAEDGIIPTKYQLKETDSEDYSERTKLNIRDSDGTLIFVPSTPIKVIDGTILTMKEVFEKNKPFMLVDLSQNQEVKYLIMGWINDKNIKVLNVAGPRESQSPGIYNIVFNILKETLELVNNQEADDKNEVKNEDFNPPNNL